MLHACISSLGNNDPRANRRSGRKPGSRVTNSTRLFTPGEKTALADSKVGVIVGWVVISLISKIWMFIRSGRGKNYKKSLRIVLHINFFKEMIRIDLKEEIVKYICI